MRRRALFVKRTLKGVFWFIAVLVVALAAYGFYFHGVMAPPMERYRAREALASAAAQDLEAAVERLGAVFHFHDGSWLAIRYRDSHTFPAWSLAIARDSGGRWFESGFHFCGTFGVVRDLDAIDRELGAESLPAHDPPRDHAEWVRLLAASPDLATARGRLLRYFREVR